MRTQSNTIPKATGSYVALARGLTAQSAFLALSSHARLTLLVAERELPRAGLATCRHRYWPRRRDYLTTR